MDRATMDAIITLMDKVIALETRVRELERNAGFRTDVVGKTLLKVEYQPHGPIWGSR